MSDEVALSLAIRTLANDPALRTQIGAANRALAVSDYDEAAMIARYATLYGLA